MKVWLLFDYVAYESNEVLGVYSNEAAAVAAQKDAEEKHKKYRWHEFYIEEVDVLD